MRSARQIRKLLNTLAGYGVLIGYAMSPRHGQCVAVWGEDGRPVKMGLGTAQAYAWRLEAQEWGM